MIIHVISPIYPSLVIRLDKRLESIHDFCDIWFMFGRDSKRNMNDLEVELCQRALNKSRFFSLNTPLDSVLEDCTEQSVLFSIDYKQAGNLFLSFIYNFYDRMVPNKLCNPWFAGGT